VVVNAGRWSCIRDIWSETIREQKVKSFLDEALGYLWIAIAVSFIVLVIVT
jgi:hypothetical protein